MKKNKRIVTLLTAMMLVMALALTAGCAKKESKDAAVTAETVYEDGSILGEGSKEFALIVVNTAGEEVALEIHTDKENVGEALLELGVIAGEESEYGLYVKTVNGETLDYDTDGKYWAFYINGEYAMTGVDATDVTDGDAYALKAE